MTIAYNSAYVQTETLNFTFARQAVSRYCVFWCQTLTINVGLPADGRHVVTAARRAAEGPFCVW